MARLLLLPTLCAIIVSPPDKPIMQPKVEFDGENEFIGRNAEGIPLRFP